MGVMTSRPLVFAVLITFPLWNTSGGAPPLARGSAPVGLVQGVPDSIAGRAIPPLPSNCVGPAWMFGAHPDEPPAGADADAGSAEVITPESTSRAAAAVPANTVRRVRRTSELIMWTPR